ncbi:hypothetical protein HQ590_15850 [bacterium]|nr:hypothetical protein [bacterium]
MRPSVSFAAGLWLGGLVVLAGGALLYRAGAIHRREAASVTTTPLDSSAAELDRLHQENARLTAEAQRWRQTVSELKDQLDGPAAFRPRRRTPASRTGVGLPGSAQDTDREGQAGPVRPMIEQLTARALNGDRRALERLVVLADRGGAPALVRLWNSGSLPAIALPTAARCLGSIIELSPGAAEALRVLFTEPQTDEALVRTALDGIVTPVASAEPGDTPARGLNALGRLEFLEQTVESAGSEPVRELLEVAIDHLARVVESAAPAQ